jgi:hypothetical protein
MLEYIYFVKCPDCEDEHFDFFNEAKEYAMSLLSKKPIITQIEVDRNDFGECIDSCDLGTVWSWEEMMEKIPTEAETVFTKADTFCDCGGKCGDNCKCGKHHEDPEFDALDNSLEVDIRKPVPADMSIEDLVEAMEENEDTVECTWCEDLFDKSECRYEVDLGWLCSRCQAAIMSRGEPLTFRENTYWDFLDEEVDSVNRTSWICFFDGKEVGQVEALTEDEALVAMQREYPELEYGLYDGCFFVTPISSLEESFSPDEEVEFIYDALHVTLQGPKRDVDDWDEADDYVRYSFYKTKKDVAVDIWENFIEDADVKDVAGGLEALEDDNAWNAFLANHFDDLLDKYYDKLLKYYEDNARDEYEETHSLGECKQKSFLEEFDDIETRKANMTDCPECGAVTYDIKEQYCSNCGLGL